ncbi:hypothetical protein MS3_00001137 [Schistosoma haematobium]|uniref:Uncharacterized protein n=1 Tax=Schistosoma haematobium TaxID=6185 RepID=A0A922LPE3_SCHHA|nr:hypothetical protein MS3_00001137 [Schistosoma haematobium]KAH9590771.1 hypothetical protein MS3_00001137 [Schistosoma haematobium]
MMVVSVLQVSASYSRTVLTFVLKILSLTLVASCFEFHVFFSRGNAPLALPIHAFISASDPPCLSITLPGMLKVSTSSRASPSIVVWLVLAVLYFSILLPCGC